MIESIEEYFIKKNEYNKFIKIYWILSVSSSVIFYITYLIMKIVYSINMDKYSFIVIIIVIIYVLVNIIKNFIKKYKKQTDKKIIEKIKKCFIDDKYEYTEEAVNQLKQRGLKSKDDLLFLINNRYYNDKEQKKERIISIANVSTILTTTIAFVWEENKKINLTKLKCILEIYIFTIFLTLISKIPSLMGCQDNNKVIRNKVKISMEYIYINFDKYFND